MFASAVGKCRIVVEVIPVENDVMIGRRKHSEFNRVTNVTEREV